MRLADWLVSVWDEVSEPRRELMIHPQVSEMTMSIAAERILLKGVWDLVSTVEVECIVTDYGLPAPDSVPRTAEAAVRELMEAGLVVVGLPVTGPVPFRVWSDDPKVAMDMLAREWESGRLDRGETFA